MAVNTDFDFYDDAALTILSSDVYSYQAKSDLSDGFHDVVKYFGCPLLNKKLQAQSNPGVDNIILTPTYILPSWQQSHAYTVGQSVIPISPNGYRYEVVTAGSSGSTQPVWGTVLNGTTNDGTVVWRLVAEDSPISEIKLATTQSGLNAATPGNPLVIGTEIMSGPANAVSVWIRNTNSITVVSETLGTPELGVNINAVTQSAI